jgi:hypothetical protein
MHLRLILNHTGEVDPVLPPNLAPPNPEPRVQDEGNVEPNLAPTNHQLPVQEDATAQRDQSPAAGPTKAKLTVPASIWNSFRNEEPATDGNPTAAAQNLSPQKRSRSSTSARGRSSRRDTPVNDNNSQGTLSPPRSAREMEAAQGLLMLHSTPVDFEQQCRDRMAMPPPPLPAQLRNGPAMGAAAAPDFDEAAPAYSTRRARRAAGRAVEVK